MREFSECGVVPQPSLMRWVAIVSVLSATACFDEDFPGVSLGTYDVRETVESDSCSTPSSQAASELAFAVDLRQDPLVNADGERSAYWRRIGTPVVQGTVSASGAKTEDEEAEDEDAGNEEASDETYTFLLTVDESYPTAPSTNRANGSVDSQFPNEAITEADLERLSGVSDGTLPQNGPAQTCVVRRSETLRVQRGANSLSGTHEIAYTILSGPCAAITAGANTAGAETVAPFAALPCELRYKIESTDFTAPDPALESASASLAATVSR